MDLVFTTVGLPTPHDAPARVARPVAEADAEERHRDIMCSMRRKQMLTAFEALACAALLMLWIQGLIHRDVKLVICSVSAFAGLLGYFALFHDRRRDMADDLVVQAKEVEKAFQLRQIKLAFPALELDLEASTGEKTCAICLEPQLAGEQCRTLRCTHVLHAYCIDSWWAMAGGGSSFSCPLCRERQLRSK